MSDNVKIGMYVILFKIIKSPVIIDLKTEVFLWLMEHRKSHLSIFYGFDNIWTFDDVASVNLFILKNDLRF